MRTLIWLLLYVPSVLLAYSVLAWKRDTTSPRWAAALGWLTLWTLPAVAYQCAWVLGPSSPYSFSAGGAVQAAPVGLWVLLGGRSVVELFEATARDLTGHRQSTMIDNVHVYLAMTAVQCALLVIVLVRRNRRFSRARSLAPDRLTAARHRRR